jgi:muramoyltetrapeptide carboxypeptidase
MKLQGPIAVVAPCGPYPPDRFAHGVAIAREAGFELDLFEDMLQPWRYLAAPDDVRLQHLERALRSPNHSAVWIARGGYGMSRLLPHLSLTGAVPKPVIGFSDATALFSLFWNEGWPSLIHGPVVNSLPITSEESRAALWATLTGGPATLLEGAQWAPGAVEAPVLGGNLCLLASLCGTPWQLDAHGAILVLEDIAEHPYRVDRMLQQLRSAGVFDGVVGIGFGDMIRCDPPEGAAWSLKEVLLDCTAALGVPIIGHLPVGHGARNTPFAWGSRMRLAEGSLGPC